MTAMTKEQILEATLDLAYEKGLGRISMSKIAEKVKLQKSSLYSHYRSKDELIEAMYGYFRDKAKVNSGNTRTDYGKLVEGRTLTEVLSFVVDLYRQIIHDPGMNKFWKVVEAERTFNKTAAQLTVEETNKMISAMKNLFYALQAKSVAHFEDPDAAALSFAMGVHSLILFECDAEMAGTHDADGMMDKYIREFCRIYDHG